MAKYAICHCPICRWGFELSIFHHFSHVPFSRQLLLIIHGSSISMSKTEFSTNWPGLIESSQYDCPSNLSRHYPSTRLRHVSSSLSSTNWFSSCTYFHLYWSLVKKNKLFNTIFSSHGNFQSDPTNRPDSQSNPGWVVPFRLSCFRCWYTVFEKKIKQISIQFLALGFKEACLLVFVVAKSKHAGRQTARKCECK